MMEENTSQDVTIEQLQDRIERLASENRRWMHLAGTNRLTDLPNSLMLYQVVLPAELKKCDEEGISIACVLISPDRLGEINEEYGRAVGDQLIVEISAFLKQGIESDERLFHPDGANFAILISDAAEGRARRKATEIRTDFREATFAVGDREFADLTCSAGVATLEGVIQEKDITQSVEGLYQKLSDRLYKAKQRGGNTIIGSAKKL